MIAAPRLRAVPIALAALALTASGCGAGAGSNGVAELTKRLPPGAETYDVADFVALREDLGLGEETDPLKSDAGAIRVAARSAMAALGEHSDPKVLAALELKLARSAATGDTPAGPVTLIGTNADTGEIGSALGDLGYVDRGGVLVGGRGEPSFRLDTGAIFVAGDPALLRRIPEEPADELPDPLLDSLDAPFVEVERLGVGCVASRGATGEADGSGEVNFRVDGEADASRVEITDAGGVDLGEPEADGDVASVEARLEPDDGAAADGFAAVSALRSEAVSYSC